jgi:FtsH-binding integral membrane protein
LRYSIVHSALIQAVLLILASLIMDGGGVFSVFLVAVATHWIVFALIALRRRNHLTGTDRVLITAGFAIYLAILPLLSLMLHAVEFMRHR